MHNYTFFAKLKSKESAYEKDLHTEVMNYFGDVYLEGFDQGKPTVTSVENGCLIRVRSSFNPPVFFKRTIKHFAYYFLRANHGFQIEFTAHGTDYVAYAVDGEVKIELKL